MHHPRVGDSPNLLGMIGHMLLEAEATASTTHLIENISTSHRKLISGETLWRIFIRPNSMTTRTTSFSEITQNITGSEGLRSTLSLQRYTMPSSKKRAFSRIIMLVQVCTTILGTKMTGSISISTPNIRSWAQITTFLRDLGSPIEKAFILKDRGELWQ